MSESFSSPFPLSPKSQRRSGELHPLSYQGRYLCPACRHGHIEQLVLMDAFACNFCRHIFTANLAEQTVQIADSAQPMSWTWTGRRWQSAHQLQDGISPILWMMGAVLILVPSLLIWLSSYIFPPLPNSQWAWFPLLWGLVTLAFHLTLVGWLLAEYYQLPIYISGKIKLRQLGEFLSRDRS